MDSPPSTSEPEPKESLLRKAEVTESKRRKKEEKVVMTVRIEGGSEKHKGYGSPGDSWSWRKYGQKPIKGSPHPRGYYRCSTAKGCPAKKQVERSRTDASTLIITYTSTHNHPGPDLIRLNSASGAHALAACEQEDQPNSEGSQPQSPPVVGAEGKHQLQVGTQQEGEKCVDQQLNSTTSDREEESLGYPPHNMIMPPQAQSLREEEEDDFFDELGELPLSSLCSNVLRSNFFDERFLLLPLWDRNTCE